ncbi:hypothetical protein AGABI1DRAFT_107928 [Agaricus bisporus var. burnettii JB137-S8]|uniref:Uncharacterized protein n=1 Tax=Agaricus bisporus var. burnettii (strain JB137-S8 / ATCC MYA-4627 / FGSC 10392) TaxID=597362 RepID=K5VTG9_AGABU|nr:uncharacterized protein AGABI1DRAFT_107928 [Agaricus bisporus var. burnettii JB137-S8]EKM77759.1 hypothetical protein AGABI1DRAFT_107928 [Agaricus bisporus var. burnettii JB137-S8]
MTPLDWTFVLPVGVSGYCTDYPIRRGEVDIRENTPMENLLTGMNRFYSRKATRLSEGHPPDWLEGPEDWDNKRSSGSGELVQAQTASKLTSTDSAGSGWIWVNRGRSGGSYNVVE